jgi:hypothetical protein
VSISVHWMNRFFSSIWLYVVSDSNYKLLIQLFRLTVSIIYLRM